MGVQLVSGPDTTSISLRTLMPPFQMVPYLLLPEHTACLASLTMQSVIGATEHRDGLLEGTGKGKFIAAASVQEIAKPRKPKGRCCIVTPHPQ